MKNAIGVKILNIYIYIYSMMNGLTIAMGLRVSEFQNSLLISEQ